MAPGWRLIDGGSTLVFLSTSHKPAGSASSNESLGQDALRQGLAKLYGDGQPTAECLKGIFEAWLTATDRALNNVGGTSRASDFMAQIRELGKTRDGCFELQEKVTDRLASLGVQHGRTLKGVLFRGGELCHPRSSLGMAHLDDSMSVHMSTHMSSPTSAHRLGAHVV